MSGTSTQNDRHMAYADIIVHGKFDLLTEPGAFLFSGDAKKTHCLCRANDESLKWCIIACIAVAASQVRHNNMYTLISLASQTCYTLIINYRQHAYTHNIHMMYSYHKHTAATCGGGGGGSERDPPQHNVTYAGAGSGVSQAKHIIFERELCGRVAPSW